jgi:Lrp/AsnC family transcriptional regulator, regulator for asnA, asnC and gidA
MFDQIDKEIINSLLKNSRIKFLDLARKLRVTGGTIHARVNKFKKSGLILGYSSKLDLKKLGYDVSAFIGVSLRTHSNYKDVSMKLRRIPEVLEAHYTTGDFSLFTKVVAKNINDFHRLLHEEIQGIDEVESTKTIVILDSPLTREYPEPLFD